MRAPLRLDISKRDLALAALWLVSSHTCRGSIQRIRQRWSALGGSSSPLVCLSVRSAFDLFLSVRELPRGSEVAISAITHPDMPALLRAHGLVPVPVDVEAATLAPTLADVERALSPKTRALLLTHLLGGSIPLEPFAKLCQARGIEVWEDCAQRFPQVQTNPLGSAVAFYSFGPLKTATSLLGGVADVRDPDVRRRMLERQSGYPLHRRLELARRTGKLAALAELAAHPRAYGAVLNAAKLLGIDSRTAMRTATKSFGATTELERLRVRPSPATLRLLSHRLELTTSQVATKATLGRALTEGVGASHILGSASGSHHWLLVVDSAEPSALQQRLLDSGFDALRGLSNLEVVAVPRERPDVRVIRAPEILRRAVVVPLHPDYSEEELNRLVTCLSALAAA